MTATIPIKATAAMSSTTENPRMFTTPIPNRRGHYRRRRLKVKRTHERNLLGKTRWHDKMTLYFLGGFVRVQLVSGVVFTIATTIGNADAGYLIRLKNGNEYLTNRYWHQGSQILFDTYGGVFGIENAFVNKIEPADQLTRLAGIPDRNATEKSQIDVKAEDRTKVGKPGTQEAKVTEKKDPNDSIIGEFSQLKKQSTEVSGMLTEEIRELLKRITTFKNKLSKDSKLFFEYAREFNDAQEIGNTVETALRTRTQ